MVVTSQCPYCDTLYEVNEDEANLSLACDECGGSFTIELNGVGIPHDDQVMDVDLSEDDLVEGAAGDTVAEDIDLSEDLNELDSPEAELSIDDLIEDDEDTVAEEGLEINAGEGLPHDVDISDRLEALDETSQDAGEDFGDETDFEEELVAELDADEDELVGGVDAHLSDIPEDVLLDPTELEAVGDDELTDTIEDEESELLSEALEDEFDNDLLDDKKPAQVTLPGKKGKARKPLPRNAKSSKAKSLPAGKKLPGAKKLPGKPGKNKKHTLPAKAKSTLPAKGEAEPATPSPKAKTRLALLIPGLVILLGAGTMAALHFTGVYSLTALFGDDKPKNFTASNQPTASDSDLSAGMVDTNDENTETHEDSNDVDTSSTTANASVGLNGVNTSSFEDEPSTFNETPEPVATATVEEHFDEPEIETTLPESSEPDVAETPSFEEPALEEPRFEEPTLVEPHFEEPVLEEPRFEEPVIEEPSFEEPAFEEPVLEEPVLEEPAFEEPVLEEPAFEEPEIELPTLVEEEPLPELPAFEEPEVNETPAFENAEEMSEPGMPEPPAFEEFPVLEEPTLDPNIVVENDRAPSMYQPSDDEDQPMEAEPEVRDNTKLETPYALATMKDWAVMERTVNGKKVWRHYAVTETSRDTATITITDHFENGNVEEVENVVHEFEGTIRNPALDSERTARVKVGEDSYDAYVVNQRSMTTYVLANRDDLPGAYITGYVLKYEEGGATSVLTEVGNRFKHWLPPEPIMEETTPEPMMPEPEVTEPEVTPNEEEPGILVGEPILPYGYIIEDFDTEHLTYDWHSWLPKGVEYRWREGSTPGALLVDSYSGFFVDGKEKDGTLTTRIYRNASGTQTSKQVYEIYFRYQDADNYYKLQIRNDGYYRIGKREEGRWSVLRGTASGGYLLIPDWDEKASTDNVSITLKGARIKFALNGQQIDWTDDRSFASGGIGIYTGKGMKAEIETLSWRRAG